MPTTRPTAWLDEPADQSGFRALRPYYGDRITVTVHLIDGTGRSVTTGFVAAIDALTPCAPLRAGKPPDYGDSALN